MSVQTPRPPSTAADRMRSASCVTALERSRRVMIEIDALWQLTEELALLRTTPVAALALVARTAGELTGAEAAAVLLHPAKEVVLASRWGAIGMPLGSKSPGIRSALDAAWGASTGTPIRSGAHDIGCLWVGRQLPAFDAHEGRVLRTLAAVTSLALPALMPGRVPARDDHEPAVAVAATAAPRVARSRHARDVGGVRPEALPLSVFPPSLLRLLEAVDAANVATIVTVVQADPVLSALVLRAASGAAEGRARTTGGIHESIVFLGLHRVRALVLGKLLRTLLSDRTPLDALLWEQAIGTGARARELRLATADGAAADVALLAGLLHAVGTIALATAHRERYERVLRASVCDDRPLADVEREEFGVASASVTHELLHAWHLESLVRGAGGLADAAGHLVLEWASAVTLVANPVWRALVTSLGASPQWLDARVAALTRRLAIDPAILSAIAERSEQALADTRRLFASD